MQIIDRLRSWWNAPKQLAATSQALEQTRNALSAAVESLNLIKYDRDELLWNTNPQNRRDLAERDNLNDEVEAWMLAGAGPRMLQPSKESLPASVPHKITERLWELELALEDRGWQRQLALAQTEFSRYGLQQIILISRLYFVKNPLIRRWVLVSGYYTFGRGIDITCDDDSANEVLQDFLTRNASEFGQIGLIEKDNLLHTDGQVFFVFFNDKGTGEQKCRTIPATEISDILTNPNDTSEPQYYLRRWIARTTGSDGETQNTAMEAYYPALNYEAPLDAIGGKPVMRDQPVYHMKVGGLKEWLFGLPEVYCGIDWARAYKSFLEDWASLNRALARFAWNLETKGGVAAIQTFQKVLSTTLGLGGTQIESNPPPDTGSAFITGPGNKLNPIKTGGQTTQNPEQGRRVLLMLCAAAGLPETFFGDASTGSLATAVSLDRPTELKFLERQERWRLVLQTICTYVLQQSNGAPGGKLREARSKVGKNGNLSDITITVKFPAVLEHDIPQMISAIIQAATLGGFQLGGTMDMRTVAELVLAELGVEDPRKVVDAMYPLDGADKYDPKNYADNGTADMDDINAVPQLDAQPNAHIARPSREAQLMYAIQKLTEAANRLTRMNT